MRKREPFFADSYFSDIYEPTLFVFKPEEAPVKLPAYQPPVNGPRGSFINSPIATRSTTLGIEANVLHTLQVSALKAMDEHQDPAVQETYLKFLRTAYLQHQDVRDAVDAVTNEQEIFLKRHRQKYDDEQEALRAKALANKNNRIQARDAIRFRWKKLIKGIAKLLEADACLSHMHQREEFLMRQLAQHDIVKISEDRVVRIYWDRFEYLPVEDISEIVSAIHDNESDEINFR